MKKDKKNKTKIIGIVGGLGPYAGLDINKKIFDNTLAFSDQEHLTVFLLSNSRDITDRTAFLNQPDQIQNPAFAIFEMILKLAQIGASVIGIPCNAAHSPLIFNRVLSLIKEAGLPVELLNMIAETKKFIKKELKGIKKAGLLATLGAYQSKVYETIFAQDRQVSLILPAEQDQKRVHEAIYDRSFGIKAFSNPVKVPAIEQLQQVIRALQAKGAQAVIMGCTEIPLALNRENTELPLIDPTAVLARALVSQAAPHKLVQFK